MVRKSNRVEVKCETCGKTKFVKPSQIKRNKAGFFCGKECRAIWDSKRMKGDGNHNYSKQKVNCSQCGKEKLVKKSRVESQKYFYCNKECEGLWLSSNRSGENHPQYDKVVVCCSNCGNEKSIKKCWEKLHDDFFCDYKCMGEWISKNRIAENSHNWRGGISTEKYPPEFDDFLKENIRIRDGRICQLCGITEEDNEQSLSCHHIDYIKENCSDDNLISLCVKNGCHVKTNGNREYWTNYFQNLMKEKYNCQY